VNLEQVCVTNPELITDFLPILIKVKELVLRSTLTLIIRLSLAAPFDASKDDTAAQKHIFTVSVLLLGQFHCLATDDVHKVSDIPTTPADPRTNTGHRP
jgi:hypothetical protein